MAQGPSTCTSRALRHSTILWPLQHGHERHCRLKLPRKSRCSWYAGSPTAYRQHSQPQLRRGNLLYSSGLRLMECLTLKPHHIESRRWKSVSNKAKAKKDRYTILSQRALLILREYFQAFRPKKWLLKVGTDIGINVHRKILMRRCSKAKINKHVSSYLAPLLATTARQAFPASDSNKLLGHQA